MLLKPREGKDPLCLENHDINRSPAEFIMAVSGLLGFL